MVILMSRVLKILCFFSLSRAILGGGEIRGVEKNMLIVLNFEIRNNDEKRFYFNTFSCREKLLYQFV